MKNRANIWIVIFILLVCLLAVIGGCADVDASENDHANNNSVPEPGTITLLIAGLIAGGAFFRAISLPSRKK
jgi:hypothetical protein